MAKKIYSGGWYVLKSACGHEDTYSLGGKSYQIEREIERIESTPCSACIEAAKASVAAQDEQVATVPSDDALIAAARTARTESRATRETMAYWYQEAERTGTDHAYDRYRDAERIFSAKLATADQLEDAMRERGIVLDHYGAVVTR